MNTMIDGLRQVIGTPEFYDVATGAVDFDLMSEYYASVIIVVLVVASVFRLLGKVFD